MRRLEAHVETRVQDGAVESLINAGDSMGVPAGFERIVERDREAAVAVIEEELDIFDMIADEPRSHRRRIERELMRLRLIR